MDQSQVQWRVREAALQEHLMKRRREALGLEQQALDSVLDGARRRYADGGMGTLTLSQWQLQQVDLRREQATTQVAVAEAHAALAEAVGVPVAELDRVDPGREVHSSCRPGESHDSSQVVALEHRLELRGALADYAVRESEVRMAVADRWPDLELGPGLFFDHGVAKWIISFAVPGLPSGRQRAAVLQAEARRDVARQTVLQVQDAILSQLDRAFTTCGALQQAADAQDVTAEQARVALVEGQYQRGEVGRLELHQSRWELARAERRVSELAARLEEAGLELEAALGVWRGAPEEPWDEPR
jgi:outer membrane protein TolC